MGKEVEIVKQVTIENVAAEGKCVTRINDKVVFVDQAAPGDVADLKIIRKRKKFSEAVPIYFHQLSPLREDPFCRHFGTCGGCKWQHLTYEAQLEQKRNQVIDNLERIAKVDFPPVKPIIGSDKTKYYRNKLEFTFSDRKWLTREEVESGNDIDRNGLGFHMPGRFDRILDIEECFLQEDPSNALRMKTKQYAGESGLEFYNPVTHQGVWRTLTIRTSNTGGLMIILQAARPEQQAIHRLLDRLIQDFPALNSVFYVINEKKNDVYTDQRLIHYHGDPDIVERIDDLEFRIGPKSFFQTNSEQAARLYREIRERAQIKPQDVVYDLYTGTGVIANFVARSARKVVGVEYVPEAIDDARMNSKINGIGNTHFFAGDLKEILTPEFESENDRPDVIITDPPRAGMHKEVVQRMNELAPRRIVYVSCNPATQARDISLLNEQYQVVDVQPIDMFPHTQHVENILTLDLRK